MSAPLCSRGGPTGVCPRSGGDLEPADAFAFETGEREGYGPSVRSCLDNHGLGHDVPRSCMRVRAGTWIESL
jgi:hypothetical protein